MNKISGSCLCGSVQYKSNSEPLMTAVCHCRNCQKQTGSSFSLIVAVPADSISIEGEENIKNFPDRGESGGAVTRRFCGNCGSPILSLVEVVPGMAFIKAGTLTDTSWLEPTSHIWCDTAQPWVDISDSLERVPRNPAA